MSSQSDGRVAQSGFGSAMRRPVSWVQSRTVKRSLGKGLPVGLESSKRGSTPAA